MHKSLRSMGSQLIRKQNKNKKRAISILCFRPSSNYCAICKGIQTKWGSDMADLGSTWVTEHVQTSVAWGVNSLFKHACKVVVTSNQGKTHSPSDLNRNKSCLVFHKLWSLWNGMICQRKEKNGCNAFCTGAKIHFSGNNILGLGAL